MPTVASLFFQITREIKEKKKALRNNALIMLFDLLKCENFSVFYIFDRVKSVNDLLVGD